MTLTNNDLTYDILCCTQQIIYVQHHEKRQKSITKYYDFLLFLPNNCIVTQTKHKTLYQSFMKHKFHIRPKFFVIFAMFCIIAANSNVKGQNIDYSILCTLQQNRTPAMDKAMQFTSNTLVVTPIVPVSLAIAGWTTDNKDVLQTATVSSLSLLITAGITEIAKLSVKRPRPYLAYPDDLVALHPVRGYSFPSGHTSLSFSIATSLSLCYPKWYVAIPSLLWASGVGFSRLYLGVHNPSDVVAGTIAGVGSALLARLIAKRLFDDTEMPLAKKSFVIPIAIMF